MNEEENINFNWIDPIIDNTLKLTYKLIENKKLQLNYIWANKITQEDLNTPKHLDDTQQNLQLTNSIFLSILKWANIINEIFEKIVYSENSIKNNNIEDKNYQEQIYSLIMTTACIIQKFKNFVEIKTKQFKKDKYLIDPLTKLQKYYGLFKNNLKTEDLSKQIDEFYNYISEFNLMLVFDGHLK